MRAAVLLAAAFSITAAFDCPADTILRLATNHREKDVDAECTRTKTDNKCTEQPEVNKLWAAYEQVQKDYSKAVAECVAIRKGSRMKRHAVHEDVERRHLNHRSNVIALQDAYIRIRRNHKHVDPNDPHHDHTEDKDKKRNRRQEHDPNDPNIDHSGHNHRKRRHEDHDATDPNIDHTGHEHRRRRHQEHDPTDPNIDHSGHNHRKRRHEDHDPTDPNIDHSGHEHRRRREADHDHSDPNIDHSGHNHRRRRHERVTDTLPYSEPEKEQYSRVKRQTCLNKGKEDLKKMSSLYEQHCDRENICLPDEDLPEGPKRAHVKALQAERAKKYTAYLSEVAMCNA